MPASPCFDAAIVSPIAVADVDTQLVERVVDTANLLVGAGSEQDDCVQGSGGLGPLAGQVTARSARWWAASALVLGS